MSILLFILGIILFVMLVVLHELGHAIVARRNGVKVEEFGIGFPPRAWGKRLKNGILFTFNWLPLGGFVRLKGEHDSATGPGSYGGAPLWVKTKILLAGVVMNWLTAVVIFTVLALIGLPKILDNQFTVPGDTQVTQSKVVVAEVTKNSPAEKAGLKQGDKLISLAGQPVTGGDQFRDLAQAHAGQTKPLVYETKGQTEQVDVALNAAQTNSQGYIGLRPGEQTLRRSTWSAPIVGVAVTAQFTLETFTELGKTVANLFTANFAEAGKNVAGPIGIFGALQSGSDSGIVPVLFLIGLISLTLAVMNVLPIPALDGGRLFVTLLFRAFKKPLTQQREEAIQAAGFLTLMLLVLVISAVDVGRIIG